jgi:hypothetical protein
MNKLTVSALLALALIAQHISIANAKGNGGGSGVKSGGSGFGSNSTRSYQPRSQPSPVSIPVFKPSPTIVRPSSPPVSKPVAEPPKIKVVEPSAKPSLLTTPSPSPKPTLAPKLTGSKTKSTKPEDQLKTGKTSQPNTLTTPAAVGIGAGTTVTNITPKPTATLKPTIGNSNRVYTKTSKLKPLIPVKVEQVPRNAERVTNAQSIFRSSNRVNEYTLGQTRYRKIVVDRPVYINSSQYMVPYGSSLYERSPYWDYSVPFWSWNRPVVYYNAQPNNPTPVLQPIEKDESGGLWNTMFMIALLGGLGTGGYLLYQKHKKKQESSTSSLY